MQESLLFVSPWSYGAVEVPGAVAISCTVRFMYQREYDQSSEIRCSSESNTPPSRLCSEPCDGTPRCQQTSEPCENKAPMPIFFHKDSHWFQESARSPPRSFLPPAFLSTATKQMALHHLQNKPHTGTCLSLKHISIHDRYSPESIPFVSTRAVTEMEENGSCRLLPHKLDAEVFEDTTWWNSPTHMKG